MDLVLYFVDLLAHFDQHLLQWLSDYGLWALAILALIIFAETGFVVFPFLPGDSMLFIVGVFCGAGTMDYMLVIPALTAAAVAGDAVNFIIGKRCGGMLLNRFPSLQRGHRQAQRYFSEHGARTIVIARFVPVLRGFAPFAAGFGHMHRGTFARYNVFGAVLWVVSLVGLGMILGDMPVVRQNLSKVILCIIAISLILPFVIERIKRKPTLASGAHDLSLSAVHPPPVLDASLSGSPTDSAAADRAPGVH